MQARGPVLFVCRFRCSCDGCPRNPVYDFGTRGWDAAVEYIDHASGAKESRPALDRLVKDAHRRKFDVVVTWKLDRLGRSLKHLIILLDDLRALGVAFVSLNEGIDATTPAGRLQMPCSARSRSSSAAASSSVCGRGWRGRRRKGQSSADGRTTSRRNGSKPSITCRCGTPPRRSASPARSCIAGGCHANPSN